MKQTKGAAVINPPTLFIRFVLISTLLFFFLPIIVVQFFDLVPLGATQFLLIAKFVKLVVCLAALAYWFFIRQSLTIQPSKSLFARWQVVALLLVQAFEAGYCFFYPSSIWHLWVLSVVSILTGLLFAHAYWEFIKKRVADFVLLTTVSGTLLVGVVFFFVPMGKATSEIAPNLGVVLASSMLFAVVMIRAQYKGKNVSENELVPLILLVSSVLEVFSANSAIMNLFVGLQHFLLCLTIVSLISRINKAVAKDWHLYNAALISSKDAFCCLDMAGRVIVVNQAYKSLLRLEKDINHFNVPSPLYAHPLQQSILQAMSNSGSWQGETVLVARDGTVQQVYANFQRIKVNGQNFDQAWFETVEEKVEFQEKENVIQEKLEQLSFNLIEKQEEERRYFAKELHDEIGQGLTLLKIQQQLPEPDKELIVSVLGELIDKVRNLSLNLRPSVLDDMGLAVALDWLVERQRKFSNLSIYTDIQPGHNRFDDKLEISIFRIAQEAFTNIHKYSHAENVKVKFAVTDSHLCLSIMDDGVGFDVNTKLNRAVKGQSLGLLSIQERSFLVNGLVDITSTPEQGTCIELRVPIKLKVEQDED